MALSPKTACSPTKKHPFLIHSRLSTAPGPRPQAPGPRPKGPGPCHSLSALCLSPPVPVPSSTRGSIPAPGSRIRFMFILHFNTNQGSRPLCRGTIASTHFNFLFSHTSLYHFRCKFADQNITAQEPSLVPAAPNLKLLPVEIQASSRNNLESGDCHELL